MQKYIWYCKIVFLFNLIYLFIGENQKNSYNNITIVILES